MSEFNILFSSAGRRVSLIEQFKQALKNLGIVGNTVATDCKKNAPGAFVADIQEQVPHVRDPNYIDVLKNICKQHQIKLLIPLIDTELHKLSLHRQDFNAIGVTLLASSRETIEICFDKRNSYNFFKQVGIQTPEILNAEEILADSEAKYPFILKPADGSCSIGVTKIWSARELEFFKNYIPNAIVQEFVVGEEYTIDILVNFQGQVRCVVPRLRIETRAGEISKGITVKNPALIAAGKKVVELLPGALGCITVQCFLTANDEIKFIEINPRFGGGFPLACQAGADFPRWIIEMMLGKESEFNIDGWQDGIVMLRYDDAIFITKDMMT